MWLESHFNELRKRPPILQGVFLVCFFFFLFSSSPDMRERLQESLANLKLDQFKPDNCLPVCTVQKMSDNEEFPNYQGFRLVRL